LAIKVKVNSKMKELFFFTPQMKELFHLKNGGNVKLTMKKQIQLKMKEQLQLKNEGIIVNQKRRRAFNSK
jgi:hypothetical protein